VRIWARVSTGEQDPSTQLVELHQWLGGAAWRSAPRRSWVGVRVQRRALRPAPPGVRRCPRLHADREMRYTRLREPSRPARTWQSRRIWETSRQTGDHRESELIGTII